jgi:tetratricopeptide (TPR) repeat protein
LIVKDEEENLPSCLAALGGFVDEIVVYDTGSVDATRDIARGAGAAVIEGTWTDDFAAARNAALAHCTGEWILWVDADELLCGDRAALRKVLAASPAADTINVTIDNVDDGGAVAFSHKATRLFRRERAEWVGRLHETLAPRRGEGKLREGFTAHISLFHTGYRDEAVAAKGKSERNIRLAEAELAEGSDRRGLVLIHLARSLASAGRLDEALERFDEALAATNSPAERRLAYRHGAEALLDTGRAEEALTWIDGLRSVSEQTEMADYLEGIARDDVGDLDAALERLVPLVHVRDDDGFALADHVLRLRRARMYRDAQRWGECADELLAIASADVSPPWATLADASWRAGRNPDEVAASIPESQLVLALGQLLNALPDAANGVIEALLRRLPGDAAVLAAACELAPRLAVEAALEWSARLRKAGLAARCPLFAIATDAERSIADRVQAGCLLFGAFGDERANDAAQGVAPAVPEADLLQTLIQMGELAPALLPGFVVAAASDTHRTELLAHCLDELGAPDAAEELLAMAAAK